MTKSGGNKLIKAIQRLNELEPELRSLDTLFALGEVITRSEGGFQAGDFDVSIWGHGLGGFSVGAIVRVRTENKPFPELVQKQKKWILCCEGKIKVIHDGTDTVLESGECLAILPMVAHEIFPVSRKCCAVISTVPDDPGMK